MVGGLLMRFGTAWESKEKLGSDAAKAEANGFPHGVSVFARNNANNPNASFAPRDAVAQTFGVQRTGDSKGHHTVLLPKPVTDEAEVIFNSLFGRTP